MKILWIKLLEAFGFHKDGPGLSLADPRNRMLLDYLLIFFLILGLILIIFAYVYYKKHKK